MVVIGMSDTRRWRVDKVWEVQGDLDLWHPRRILVGIETPGRKDIPTIKIATDTTRVSQVIEDSDLYFARY